MENLSFKTCKSRLSLSSFCGLQLRACMRFFVVPRNTEPDSEAKCELASSLIALNMLMGTWRGLLCNHSRIRYNRLASTKVCGINLRVDFLTYWIVRVKRLVIYLLGCATSKISFSSHFAERKLGNGVALTSKPFLSNFRSGCLGELSR